MEGSSFCFRIPVKIHSLSITGTPTCARARISSWLKFMKICLYLSQFRHCSLVSRVCHSIKALEKILIETHMKLLKVHFFSPMRTPIKNVLLKCVYISLRICHWLPPQAWWGVLPQKCRRRILSRSWTARAEALLALSHALEALCSVYWKPKKGLKRCSNWKTNSG